jgi:predicted dehydrogenase
MDNNLKICLIIGAGQLGSRHLQGLVKILDRMEIYVLDPSLSSLRTAQDREREIINNHKVVYTQSWDDLPDSFTLVIIATNAIIRESLVNKLLEKHKVQFLILEKILFQELAAYKRVHEILVKHNVKTYVNHPRRIFESYRNLKSILKSNLKSVYSVVGGNWGLGCNSIHFLDLFVFLSGEKLKDLDVKYVEDELYESSRTGFVEFAGTISGQLSNDSFFSITSIQGESSSVSVSVLNNEQRFVIQEGGTPQIYVLEKEDLFKCKSDFFKILYQSESTTNIAFDLFETGICLLPTYDEARHTHELFISKMLEKYNKITGLKSTILPIT